MNLLYVCQRFATKPRTKKSPNLKVKGFTKTIINAY